jgi:hypothetical protein
MFGPGIMDNLYTLFWVFALIFAFVIGGALYENMEKIRAGARHAARACRKARMRQRKAVRSHAQAGTVFSRSGGTL